MSLRGYELISVEVSPFEYNAETNTLKVYNNPEVIILETGPRINSNQAPRSRIFEEMYKNTVIRRTEIDL